MCRAYGVGVARDERLILSIAVGASFVAFMNNTVITVTLPRITEELGGGLPGQQWMINAYLVTLGSLILVAGSVSDVLGRGLVLRIGLIGFAIASTAIALAPTAELMIAFRALQGAAGAFLVPSSLALITSTFRDAAQARAIGVWTAATSGLHRRARRRWASLRLPVLAMGIRGQPAADRDRVAPDPEDEAAR